MTYTEQLKVLAEAAKNWHVNHAMPENDDGIVEVGHMLDGEFYPIVIVDCVQYDQSSQPLAAYIAAANPERILALIAENERLTHSRKDAEPVGWKCFHCVKESCYSPTPARQEDQRDTHPPEADKLLQQALEALDNSVDVVREEYTEAVRRYSGLPSRKARLDSLNALLTKHESSITDIRTYLEGKK